MVNIKSRLSNIVAESTLFDCKFIKRSLYVHSIPSLPSYNIGRDMLLGLYVRERRTDVVPMIYDGIKKYIAFVIYDKQNDTISNKFIII